VTEPLLQVRGLRASFPVGGGLLRRSTRRVVAVDGVDFHVAAGETLALVGESGCGKTTVGRSILRLHPDPPSGSVLFDGQDVLALGTLALRRLRRHMQVVFQDPFSSLNPRLTVRTLVGEAVAVHGLARGRERVDRVEAILRRVGLSPDHMNRYPHEFSGGQRQRICIARALVLEPRFVVCDEAVSALDVSVQAQIVNLLADLQEERGLSYLFIAHDLALVRHIAHRTAVMYMGRIVETGPTEALFAEPRHPYTQALIAAIPQPFPGRRRPQAPLRGEVPSLLHPPAGCRFHTRCPHAEQRCRHGERPMSIEVGPGHAARCHLLWSKD